jgi:hypothetical protein
MLSDATQRAIHRWVDNRFEVTFSDIPDDDFYLIEHGGRLTDYAGVYVWRMGEKTLVSLPTGMFNAISVPLVWQLAIDEAPLTALTDPALWRAALGARVERVVGPSYQGFLDTGAFRPVVAIPGVRPLTAADQPALRRFIATCPADDWQDSAIALDQLDRQPIVGLERDGALIALASAPGDEAGPGVVMRSVGVVTLPATRGMGAGLAVVSALTARCLASGALLHYQTLRANLPSVAIARRLGYADVATALAVRLTPH